MRNDGRAPCTSLILEPETPRVLLRFRDNLRPTGFSRDNLRPAGSSRDDRRSAGLSRARRPASEFPESRDRLRRALVPEHQIDHEEDDEDEARVPDCQNLCCLFPKFTTLAEGGLFEQLPTYPFPAPFLQIQISQMVLNFSESSVHTLTSEITWYFARFRKKSMTFYTEKFRFGPQLWGKFMQI